MEKPRKNVTVGNLLHACAPLALYYLISTLASYFYMQFLMMEAGFAVIESEAGDVYDYIMQEFPGRILEIVLLTALMAIPVFCWMYVRDLKERDGFSLRNMVVVLEIRPAAWALAGGMCLALLLNLLILASPLPTWSPDFQQIQDAVYQGSIWSEIAVSGVAAAVMEELLMRGILYGRMREMMSAGRAVFWSALAFGICHGSLVQGIYGFFMGCFLGYLMERFRTVLIPILAHMSVNVLMILLSESGGLETLMESPLLMWPAAAVCGLTAAFALAVIRMSGKLVSGENAEKN